MAEQQRSGARTIWARGRGVALGLIIGLGLTGVMAAGPALVGLVSAAGFGQLGGGGGIPLQINHQGVIMVSGARFNGDGDFRFALVDPDDGNNVWTNDGTNVGTDLTPTSAVTLTVINGIYNVALGDTGLANMTTIPSATFNDDNLVLRIWFDDGVAGVRQLTPDHKLTSVPYAYRASVAAEAETATSAGNGVPVGTIMAWHKDLPGTPALPDGWVECNGQVVTDPESPYFDANVPNLNSADGYVSGRFLRGGATSGEMQDGSDMFHGPRIGCEHFLWHHGANVNVHDGEFTHPYGNSFLKLSLPDGCYVETVTRRRVRPVNMTVIWIIRIK